jgi:hypothetical protein
MELKELAQILDLEELTEAGEPAGNGGDAAHGTVDITRGYASDLLSDVLANAPQGGLLVTLQVHLNVIAVASHAGLRAVIFSCGRQPDDDVVEKAQEEGIALYASEADTFEIVGRLHELGIRGSFE